MDPAFDRGEIDRASLEATERLRQRMVEERRIRPEKSAAAGRILPWALAGGLLLFLGGMVASPWFETQMRSRLPFLEPAPAVVAPAEIDVLARRLAELETRPVASDETAGPNERLARTEARVETSTDLLAREADRIDRLTAEVATLTARLETDRLRDEAAAAAVSTAADRTEGILAVMLARRALDEGQPLGAIDAALHRAFEMRYPDAVALVVAYGARPVRLADLRRQLAIMPGLDSEAGGRGRSWWDILGARVTGLVRSSNADAGPALRTAAQAALARGDVRAAIVQLKRLPAPRPAGLDGWLASAERYAAAHEALLTLETAALIPRANMTEVAPAPPGGTN